MHAFRPVLESVAAGEEHRIDLALAAPAAAVDAVCAVCGLRRPVHLIDERHQLIVDPAGPAHAAVAPAAPVAPVRSFLCM